MAHFSVIIPLYNKERYVQVAIKSVLQQTFQDFEIIVINDGSTDGSLAAVEALTDDRIIVVNTKNHGVSHARNLGIQRANSEWIVLLDGDDYWKPTHLADLITLQSKFPNCGLYATAYQIQFNEHLISADYYQIPKQENWMGRVEDFFTSSTVHCIASCSSVMIPKPVLENVGGFNEIYNSGEDIDLWIRIALQYDVAFMNVVSVVISMNVENQVSQTTINSRNHLDFQTFAKDEATNKNLKIYLDLNRFSLAIQHIVAGNTKEASALINNIDLNSLNKKQRLLLQMNAPLLKGLMQLKNRLRNRGIGLSAFR